MLTKTKTEVRIPRREWEKLKKNPQFIELIELLEDQEDFEKARRVRGKDLTLEQYVLKRGIRNNC